MSSWTGDRVSAEPLRDIEPAGWDADGVLVRRRGTGLTGQVPTGKTGEAAHRKQGMTPQQTHVPATPVPCQSAGPPLDVVEWRQCRLREAGFPARLARDLARQRIDLHALLELVDAGCPPDLAARILSPLDGLDPAQVSG